MIQPTILRFDSIDSTNVEAMRQAKDGAPEGLCIVAREQTAGRGRLDRSWQSPKDAGLYASIVLRPRFEIATWPVITLMAALAVSDALVELCQLQADIKWPNDLCIDDRKLCGILAETAETPTGPAVILGIGINLRATDLGEDLNRRVTSVESETNRAVNTEQILEALLRSLGDRYELLHTDSGREHTIREWCARSSYAFERRVTVLLAGHNFSGVTRGLERDGALRVETADGKVIHVRAGDVTAVRGFDTELHGE